jgi:hypothetical protein
MDSSGVDRATAPLASGFAPDVLQTGRNHDIGGIDALE